MNTNRSRSNDLSSHHPLDSDENSLTPAFPSQETQVIPGSEEIISWLNPGLTKREFFAAIAMHAVASRRGTPDNKATYECYVQQALHYADTLLEQLEKHPKM